MMRYEWSSRFVFNMSLNTRDNNREMLLLSGGVRVHRKALACADRHPPARLLTDYVMCRPVYTHPQSIKAPTNTHICNV